MSDPLVSACIGVFNREDYIRETLDSVLAQTYRNIEIVVVDDASTDRTVEMIEREYAGRVRLIRRDTNSGMCPVTRNQAARAARGEFLAFLDSDDAWYPRKIEAQVDFLRRHPAIPVCHTYCHLMDAQSRVTGIRHHGRLPPTGNCFRELLRHCWITISSVMARRAIFDEVGWFIEDPRYGIWGEELEFLLRVSRRHEIGLVDDVLTKYRRAGQNISSGNWKQIPESVPFNEMLLNREDIWRGRVTREEVVEALVENCLANSEYWQGQGYPERGLYFARLALKHAPGCGAAWRAAAMAVGRKVFGRSAVSDSSDAG